MRIKKIFPPAYKLLFHRVTKKSEKHENQQLKKHFIKILGHATSGNMATTGIVQKKS